MKTKSDIISRLKSTKTKTTKVSLPKAAVFIPLVEVDQELHLLFQVRSYTLVWQPGDISFPGGKIEPSDSSPVAAACRETCEELGLSDEDLLVHGILPSFNAALGLEIFPVMGEILHPENIKINPDEVAEVFTVPVSWLLASPPQIAHMQSGSKPADDFPFNLLPNHPKEWRIRSSHAVYFYPYKQYIIWGLTAQILHAYLDVIRT
ncbi:NUDIX hydrolase [Zophobihabitans entericus]|uniref:CoA pyrophosphatase n=1 Tax=Zophobihabitans entericus TaxID=1635327 RepID=A0A6G9IC30_9GAMM|nr:CoA pyrophosphatase [Zophobihabitans entericus]QIQ21788.1 CoA pyrophosphatase [Zophobihabitans entericus]